MELLKLSRIKGEVVVVEIMGSDLEPSAPARLAALKVAPSPARPPPPRRRAPRQAEQGLLDAATVAELRRMHTAIRMNRYLLEYSHRAELVVLYMPGLPPTTDPAALGLHMGLVEAMTEGLSRTLLVRGGGREVITIFS